MEAYEFRLVGVGHSQSQSGHVLITFRRKEGTEFGVVLSAEDGRRLCEELPEQIRIASPSAAKPT